MALARLRKRLPVRLRQNWKVLAVGIAGVIVATTVFGGVVIRPYSTTTSAVAGEEQITQNIAGSVSLFDETVDHEVTLSYSEDDYDRMLDAYFTEGEKEWMVADVTIDGTTIDSVAVRLKGNSTLSGLTDGREGSETHGQTAPGGIGATQGEGMPGGGQLPEGMEVPEGMEIPEGMEMPGGMPGGATGGSVAGTLSTEEPENLPLLLSFDEYHEGRAYQGMTEIAVRPASSSFSSTMNEAVALEITAQSGQVTQRYSYTTFTVNDRPSTTRLVLEHPDYAYASDLEGEGVLFKVLATASFTYQGDDQTEYTDDFEQLNLVGSQDLQPIISFLKWLDGASDEEFAADLGEWIDVDSFARYLATQDLIGNTDTLSGPGRNGLLYYDLDTGLISVLSWDLNLALGGMPGSGRGAAPDAGAGEGMPAMPEGGGNFGGMMGGDNALVTRFEADPGFADRIAAATAELQSEFVESGAVADIVAQVADRVPVSDGLDQATIDADAEAVLSQLEGAASSP